MMDEDESELWGSSCLDCLTIGGGGALSRMPTLVRIGDADAVANVVLHPCTDSSNFTDVCGAARRPEVGATGGMTWDDDG